MSTIASRFERSSFEKESEYLTHSKTEIVSVLRALKERREQGALYYGDGNLIMSMVLSFSVEKDRLILDCSLNEAENQLILKVQKAVFVAFLDHVKVQFEVPPLRKVIYMDSPAFAAQLPKAVLRIQKRDTYRLALQSTKPIMCTIFSELGDIEARAEVFNISAGGIGIVDSEGSMQLEQFKIYPHCRLDLPEIGMLTVGIQIRSTFDVAMKDGSIKHKAGCQFVGLNPKTESLIQRFIMTEEAKRRSFRDG